MLFTYFGSSLVPLITCNIFIIVVLMVFNLVHVFFLYILNFLVSRTPLVTVHQTTASNLVIACAARSVLPNLQLSNCRAYIILLISAKVKTPVFCPSGYRKILKISPVAFFQRLFLRGLYSEGFIY